MFKNHLKNSAGFISTFSIFSGKRAVTGILAIAVFLIGAHLVYKNFICDNNTDNNCADYARPFCVFRGAIENNQSLFTALTSAGISPVHVDEIRIGLKGLFDLRKLSIGDRFEIAHSPEGDTMTFTLERSDWESYHVFRSPDTLYGVKDSAALEYNIRAAQGTVSQTLWQTMKDAGMPDRLIFAFTDLLSYDFDFVTDTRNGQSFRVLYEEYTYRGQHVKFGKILLAQYNELSGKSHSTCLFVDPTGKEGYYNLEGKSSKRSLLKTPLSFSRISSTFTTSRYHPILKIFRPHLGVDFAAPTGTPVVASGSGTITFAGTKGGYGNFIEIRHDLGIVTMYGHLSRFASGIRTGVHVSEGSVIGYVGATGLATGPHLDYRVSVKGKFVNPLKYAAPSGPPVDPRYLAMYKKTAGNIVETASLLCSGMPPLVDNVEKITEAKADTNEIN